MPDPISLRGHLRARVVPPCAPRESPPNPVPPGLLPPYGGTAQSRGAPGRGGAERYPGGCRHRHRCPVSAPGVVCVTPPPGPERTIPAPEDPKPQLRKVERSPKKAQGISNLLCPRGSTDGGSNISCHQDGDQERLETSLHPTSSGPDDAWGHRGAEGGHTGGGDTRVSPEGVVASSNSR